MRLFEMKDLPKVADKAVLEWDKGIQNPKRDGKKIWLPRHDSVEFFPLQNNRQFLLLSKEKKDGDHYSERKIQELFFGGTDENPFLVQLRKDETFRTFKMHGENGFYDILKPKRVKNLEETFKAKSIRQGDWFMVPFPIDWKSFISTLAFLGGDKLNNLQEGKELSLGSTRHLISGKMIQTNTWYSGDKEHAYIGEGVVSAPDHKSKKLNSPHVFIQVDILHNPQKAD